MGREVRLDMFKFVQQGDSVMTLQDFRAKYKFISLVSLQNDCQPCYTKYVDWHHKMDSIGYGGDYTVLFIIRGRSYEDFLSQVIRIENIGSKFWVVMDPNYSFPDGNSQIPTWVIDYSLLIDSGSKIRMIGQPFYSPKAIKRFREITGI
jgi:hypothetical protein